MRRALVVVLPQQSCRVRYSRIYFYLSFLKLICYKWGLSGCGNVHGNYNWAHLRSCHPRFRQRHIDPHADRQHADRFCLRWRNQWPFEWVSSHRLLAVFLPNFAEYLPKRNSVLLVQRGSRQSGPVIDYSVFRQPGSSYDCSQCYQYNPNRKRLHFWGSDITTRISGHHYHTDCEPQLWCLRARFLRHYHHVEWFKALEHRFGYAWNCVDWKQYHWAEHSTMECSPCADFFWPHDHHRFDH